jgi:hypothetical protein
LRSHEGSREEKYRILYDDIAANQEMWMEFFDDKFNYRHAENTCGILVRTSINLGRKRISPSFYFLFIVFGTRQHFSDFLFKGTLATIYRRRGRLRECEAILDIELEILIRYQRSSEGAIQEQVCSIFSISNPPRKCNAPSHVDNFLSVRPRLFHAVTLLACIVLRRAVLQVQDHPLQSVL